ncbi:MAG TPA: ABC transporter ATP-binding protein, partial [Thermoanaerobaculia bacterium]|nr:ABC transporter ATP-binding protein [Thermoanaerobaculia bacterium]
MSERARLDAGAASAPLLEVRGLVVRYGDTVAVDHADLRVPPGRITAILGPSGCGKTSLLRAIAGFGEVAGGSIEIGGRRVVGGGAWVPPERRRIGMVFQEGALFPHLTVSGNVGYGLRGAADAADRVTEVLRLVGLEGLESRFPDQLSGGQQQRVALARALAPEPSLVLLDEPFANLDAVLRVHLREEVRRILRAVGTTAVLVTHEQEEALSIADVVAVM